MRLYIDGRRSSGMTESICKNVCALEKGMKPNKKLCVPQRLIHRLIKNVGKVKIHHHTQHKLT